MTKKVVIIDDEKDLCLLIKSFLLQQGFIVFTAYSLYDGLKMIQEIRPDILIMDNNLPDGSGWDNLNLIRGQLPDCKIILISAFNSKFTSVVQDVSILEKPVSLLKLQYYIA
jgi:DNA-binding response OmpR family regulator